MGPDVDDLVVAFAGRNEPRGVLFFDLANIVLGALNDCLLLVGYDHVVYANRDARACCVVKARVHQSVGENHCFLEADIPVARVEQPGNRPLVESPVDQLER